MLRRVADAIESAATTHPTRVAIDGIPASGKTTLADELADVLVGRDRTVIRASIDDFLVPRVQRYRHGEYSAEACYFDAHDITALCRVLLDPLGPDGHRRFQRAVYDAREDAVLSPLPETAPNDAVLVFDGVFLMRPELDLRWELRILVSTTVDTAVGRASARDRDRASRAEIERRWSERYLPAQRLYADLVNPAERADLLVDNNDPRRPVVSGPA